MTVKPRTKKISPMWMTIADVALDLGVDRSTAHRRLEEGQIPGRERMYGWDDGRTHWHVNRAIYMAWKAAQQAA